MLQKKTEPLRAEEIPGRVPKFLADLKPSNFGWLNDRVVCHDYGLTGALKDGMSARLVSADFGGET